MLYSWLAYQMVAGGVQAIDRQTAAVIVLLAIVELSCEGILCLLLLIRPYGQEMRVYTDGREYDRLARLARKADAALSEDERIARQYETAAGEYGKFTGRR